MTGPALISIERCFLDSSEKALALALARFAYKATVINFILISLLLNNKYDCLMSILNPQVPFKLM